MKLIESAALPPEVQVEQGHLFLPTNDRLLDAVADTEPTEEHFREIAKHTLAIMGIGELLVPGEVIMKPHEKVAERHPVAPEQFFHADHSDPGRAAILFIGFEGSDPRLVPPTQVVHNARMLEQLDTFVAGSPLEDRLDEILVVRPYLDPSLDNETRLKMEMADAERISPWMDYPRHVLSRLASPKFRDLLTPEQRASLDERTKGPIDTSRYTGDIYLGKLIGQSVLNEQPIPACGSGSREIRLVLKDGQTKEETDALAVLHDQITIYLLDPEVRVESEKITRGSAMLVGKDQLHRSTPYRRGEHFRSIAAAKCYAAPGQTAPPSWVHARGTDY